MNMNEMLSSAREERKQAQNEIIKLEERLKQLLTQSDKRTSLISQVENLEHEHKACCDKLDLLHQNEDYAMGDLSWKFALTPQEMEILHVKRGWICYYWELAAKYGYKDAEAKHDHWKNLCLQYDSNVVVCAGEATSGKILNLGSSPVLDLNNVETEFIDSMDEVEMGMGELAIRKVEDFVAEKLGYPEKRSTDLGFPLSEEDQEVFEYIKLRQAWLIYFWGRAKAYALVNNAGVRLKFWKEEMEKFIDKPSRTCAMTVKQGLLQLRKLGIECKLWNALRDRSQGIIYRKDEWEDGQTS